MAHQKSGEGSAGMVERPGINVDQLVELLVNNAAAELTTLSCGF
ncbi:MAG: hypothetical protein QFX33_00415 [Candidatus Nezhaarchaeota archaeon]|nr:hypothetical protein [Candidatus Nezhaarchaeota archaeon]